MRAVEDESRIYGCEMPIVVGDNDMQTVAGTTGGRLCRVPVGADMSVGVREKIADLWPGLGGQQRRDFEPLLAGPAARKL